MGCLGRLICGAEDRDNSRIDAELVTGLNEGLARISQHDALSDQTLFYVPLS
jgi:hypothetical protein